MASTPSPEPRSPRYGFQSPNVRTRLEEKEQLSGLNDRLATYIDRMRILENENSKLTAEITTSRESSSREVGNVKALFEKELAETRRTLDEVAKEKAVLSLENKKLNQNLEDLRHKLDKETNAHQRAQEELKRVERRLHEKESLIIVISKERKELDERCKDLEEQLKLLQDEVDEHKSLAEKEILRRIEAENRLQTLQEEKEFNAQIHAKEIADLKYSAESMSFTMEVDGVKKYDGLLRDKLQELREEFEDEAENAKKELEDAYRQKFEDLRDQADRGRNNSSREIKKYTEIKIELDKLKTDYNVLNARNIQLQNRIIELEDMREKDKEDHAKDLQDRDDKINKLQDKIDDLEREYEILLGLKVALDMEIAAYRNMLEGEEERLHIPTPTSQPRSASNRGRKRAREESANEPTVDNTAVGNIEVLECDPKGKFVRLQNTADHDEPLGGWYISRTADGKDEAAVDYKFTPKYVLKAKQQVTLWSLSSGMKHKAPTDLLLKTGDWNIGASNVTTVINPDAEIVAKHTMEVPIATEEAPRRTRKRRTGAERESCAVM